MRPWQARKEKRSIIGGIYTFEKVSLQGLLEGSHAWALSDTLWQVIPDARSSDRERPVSKFLQFRKRYIQFEGVIC